MPRSGARLHRGDARRIKAFLDQIPPERRDYFAHAVMRDLTKLSASEARQQIVTGRGEDPVVAPPLPKRLTFRTGNLTRSIGTDLSEAPKRYVIGSTAKYSPQHELGLAPYPKRAFLKPGADKALRENAKRLFRKYWERLRR